MKKIWLRILIAIILVGLWALFNWVIYPNSCYLKAIPDENNDDETWYVYTMENVCERHRITEELLLKYLSDMQKNEIIDDCIIPEDCVVDEPMEEDLSNKYLTAFWTEPFWNIEISWWIAEFSSPMYDTNVTVPVNIRQERWNYYFSWEELEGEFIKKDCLDWWKGDLHYYTVWVAKFRDYYYEWCGDDEQGIKLSDEDVPEDWYQSQQDNEYERINNIIQEKMNNWFSDMESCMQSLDQYQPERMPWDPQTIISVWCWPLYYWEAFITGYLYTSTYPDLWLRITTPKWYNTFYEKSETPIFVRDWNKISYWDDYEYIRVYEKSEDESLYDIINSKHLNPNCAAYKREQSDLGTQKVYWALDYVIYDIHYEDDYWRIFWEDCISDDEATEPDYRIVRYFESPEKTKYYKMVFTDWCAPGPCSIFDEVEIF